PELESLSRRLIDQHRHIAFRRHQVADEKRNRARGLYQDLTQRKHIAAGERMVDDGFHQSHGLVTASLQPKYAREEALGYRTLVEHETDDLRPDHRHFVLTKHALEVLPRLRLFAEEVEDEADHAIAHEDIHGVHVARGECRKPFGQRQGTTKLAPVKKAGP